MYSKDTIHYDDNRNLSDVKNISELSPHYIFKNFIREIGHVDTEIKERLFKIVFSSAFNGKNYQKLLSYRPRFAGMYRATKAAFLAKFIDGETDKDTQGLITEITKEEKEIVDIIRQKIKKEFCINIPSDKNDFIKMLHWYYTEKDNIITTYNSYGNKNAPRVFLADLDTYNQNITCCEESFLSAIAANKQIVLSLSQACDSKFIIHYMSNVEIFRKIMKSGAVLIGASGKYLKIKPSEYISEVPDYFIYSSNDMLNGTENINIRREFQEAVRNKQESLTKEYKGGVIDFSPHLKTILLLDEYFEPDNYVQGIYEDFATFIKNKAKEMKLKDREYHICKDRSEWINNYPKEAGLANYLYNLYFALLVGASQMQFRIPDDNDYYYDKIRAHSSTISFTS